MEWNKKKQRLTHIESIRGVAALLVILVHVPVHLVQRIEPTQLSGIWFSTAVERWEVGRIGVLLFFQLSGFVIPYSLDSYSSSQNPAHFWICRIYRLYPMYWVSMIPAALFCWTLWNRAITLPVIIGNLTMVPNVFAIEALQAPYWTLYVEVLFYIICWILFILGFNRNGTILAILGLFFLCTFCQIYNCWLESCPNQGVDGSFVNFGYLSFMFFGALQRLIYDGSLNRFQKVLTFSIFTYWSFIFPLFQSPDKISRHPNGFPKYSDKYTISLPFPIAMLSFILLVHFVRLQLKSLIWLGKISYSMYLLHWPLNLCMIKIASKYYHGVIAVIFWTFLVLAVTILISWFTFKFVENPMMNRGRKRASLLTL